MSPRPYMTKARAAKAKKAINSKNKKKPEGRAAPSRGWTFPMLPPKKPDPIRRNPGRMDGVLWKGSTFICSNSVDGGRTTQDVVDSWPADSDSDSDWDGREVTPPRKSNMTISLSDIARPAKPRGVAKEYEVIESLQRVIVEDEFDDEFEFQADDEWEDIYADDWDRSRQARAMESYSAIVRGNRITP